MPRSTIFYENSFAMVNTTTIHVGMLILVMFKTLEEIDLMVSVTYAEAK